jgi:hypothetical protein
MGIVKLMWGPMYWTPLFVAGTNISLKVVSPHKLQGELKDTRGLRLSDLPEGRRVHVENGRDQVDMVCHVEGFRPELHS